MRRRGLYAYRKQESEQSARQLSSLCPLSRPVVFLLPMDQRDRRFKPGILWSTLLERTAHARK